MDVSSNPDPPVGQGPSRRDADESSSVAGDLAILCARFGLGRVLGIRRWPGGNPSVAKVLIQTAGGRFLIKHRDAAPGSARRLASVHALQAHLARHDLPVPPIVAGPDGRSWLQLGRRLYEVFGFVPGGAFDRSVDTSRDAGRVLGVFHTASAAFSGSVSSGPGFHDLPALPGRVGQIGLDDEHVVDRLRSRYIDAAARASGAGFASWPVQTIHGDWHPGNMRFRGGRVCAVLDLDDARSGPRAEDVATGALHFSMSGTGRNPDDWPVYLDRERLVGFCGGYDSAPGQVLSAAECEALPWLMIEALIVEAVTPILRTGRFGSVDPRALLGRVDAKAAWIADHAADLCSRLSS